MVVASFSVRFGAAIPHSTPRLFPDEYIYSQLGRSIAHGTLTIRGHAAHFPALLEPILTAPFWLLGDVETVFRLTQALNSLAASLVAVPVYLLARQLKLAPWQGLLCAATALALPSLVYASYATADSLGMTLAVAAVYLGARALEKPTRTAQVGFLALTVLAAFTRVQYVAILVAFAVAAVVVEGTPLRAIRSYRLLAALAGVPLAAALAAGPSRSLGYYHGVLDFHVGFAFARWLGSDAMLLVYASGVVLLPVALTGMTAALIRPRSRLERGLAGLALSTGALLLTEASLYAANGSARFQERYLIAFPPLVPILFCVALQRRRVRAEKIATAGVALALVVVAAAVPLSGYAAGFSSLDSPFLQAVLKLELLTSAGMGSLLLALTVLVLAPVAMLPAWHRRAGVISLAAGLVFLGAASVAATAVDFQSSRAARQILPSDPRWIDRSGERDVSVLVTPSTFRPVVSAQLFWNRSITRILQMNGGDPVDSFGLAPTSVRRDGTLVTGDKPVTGSVLVEEYADAVTMANAHLVRRTAGTSLWRSDGAPRLETLTRGRYLDGWLALPETTVTVWPDLDRPRRGVLCFSLSLPGDARPTLIRFRGRGVDTRVEIGPSERRTVGIPVSVGDRPRTLSVTGSHVFVLGGDRMVSVHAERPRLLEQPVDGAQVQTAACR